MHNVTLHFNNEKNPTGAQSRFSFICHYEYQSQGRNLLKRLYRPPEQIRRFLSCKLVQCNHGRRFDCVS